MSLRADATGDRRRFSRPSTTTSSGNVRWAPGPQRRVRPRPIGAGSLRRLRGTSPTRTTSLVPSARHRPPSAAGLAMSARRGCSSRSAGEPVQALIDISVPILTVLLLAAVGMDLTWRDFVRLRRQPALVIAGLVGPVVLLPPIAVALAWVFASTARGPRGPAPGCRVSDRGDLEHLQLPRARVAGAVGDADRAVVPAGGGDHPVSRPDVRGDVAGPGAVAADSGVARPAPAAADPAHRARYVGAAAADRSGRGLSAAVAAAVVRRCRAGAAADRARRPAGVLRRAVDDRAARRRVCRLLDGRRVGRPRR